MKNIKLENVVGALALALSDAVLSSTQEQAPEAGPAAAAIALLGHEPGMTIERLRKALGLSHPGAVRLIDRLVAENVVERKQSESDRRAVALHLTNAGENSCGEILKVRYQRIAQVLDILDPTERETLGMLTEKLLGNLVRDVDKAYSVCRLCDSSICTNCPVEAGLESNKC